MRFTQFVRPKQTQEANLQNAKVKKRKVNRIEKKYNADMMIQALDAIGCGQSLREVSHRFQIPKSTIHDKLKQYSPINCKKGPPTVLNETVENNIVDWIIYCSERGFPITKIQLLECVQKYVSDKKIKTPFVNNRPGKEWYNAFMKRHKGRLSLRIAQNLTSMRASVTEEDLRNWFVHTKTYLEKNDLINLEMDRVFNLDETAFMLVPKDNSVLCKKGSRSVYQIIGSSEKANLTVLFTAIASGLVLPPMILYDLKTAPKKNILSRIPTGWGVGHTERGWMTSESFYSYITNVFFKWLNDNNYKFPIILYVDGHSSHLTLPLCRFCKEHQIELIALHPNSTHVLQPLDVAFFHPLKEQYKKTLRKWRIENNILDFKKYMFAEVLKLVIEQNDFSSSIQNGFRVCGLYPFDPNAVNYNILNKAKKKKSSADSVLRNKSNNNYRDTFNLLQILETKFISPDLLNNFEENEFVHWQGDISQKGLFEVWCKIRRLCDKVITDSIENIIVDSAIDVENSLIPEDINEVNKNENLLNSSENCNLNSEDFTGYQEHVLDLSKKNYNSRNHFLKADVDENVSVDYIIDSTKDTTEVINVEHNQNHLEHNQDKIFQRKIENLDLHGLITSNIININNNYCDTHNKLVFKASDSYKSSQNVDLSIMPKIPEISSQRDISSVINVLDEISCDPMDSGLGNKFLNLKDKIITEPMENQTGGSSIALQNFSIVEDINMDNPNKKIPTFHSAFPIPTFEITKTKKAANKDRQPVAVIDDLLDVLEKKDEEKKLKERKIMDNRREKERLRVLKQKENEITKTYQNNKKKLQREKKCLYSLLRELKKQIKLENNKENTVSLEKKKAELAAKVEEVDKIIIKEEFLALSQKIKIKEEC